ncbi:MAG: hypothetical protein EBU70_01930, partial [Actinobacteria bacterium]|nr:hypothetical protein [Actinomycetota bacterium]
MVTGIFTSKTLIFPEFALMTSSNLITSCVSVGTFVAPLAGLSMFATAFARTIGAGSTATAATTRPLA